MPRKKLKVDGFHLKFIPTGRLPELQKLAEQFPHINDTTIALMKYVETFSNITERARNSDKRFVPVSTGILKKKLGLDDKGTSRILNDLVANNFLLREKSTFVLGKAAWSYKPVHTLLDAVKINRSFLNSTTDKILADETKVEPALQEYGSVVKKITVDDFVFDFINSEEFLNIQKKRKINNEKNKKKVKKSEKFSEELTLKIVNTNCNNDYKSNETFYNTERKSATVSTCIYDNSFVPYAEPIQKQHFAEHNSFVPYEVIGRIPTELISVYKLMAGRFRVKRKIAGSRVYTNITNLAREFRPFLRLNGKPLIGFDIANSQPLIAAIAFRKFTEQEYDCIKDDVLDYQRACERGKFYEYFMELNGIDTTCEDARSAFKAEFFGKVFYTKEVEKDNYLKVQFRDKYPTCHEAIFRIKGDHYYSKTYADFPALMTLLETEIMFTANEKVIEMGYDAVNIFDSLYSDSDTAIAIAKDLVIKGFARFGITPTLKDINYRTEEPDLNEKIMVDINDNAPQLQPVQSPVTTSRGLLCRTKWEEYRDKNWNSFFNNDMWTLKQNWYKDEKELDRLEALAGKTYW
jgi:hypothetical protein